MSRRDTPFAPSRVFAFRAVRWVEVDWHVLVIAMVLMAGLITTLFLGGWHLPYVTDPADHSLFGGILSMTVFFGKVTVLLFTTVWIRWTLPRFRYDQVMRLGWKFLLPLALCNLAVLATINVMWKG